MIPAMLAEAVHFAQVFEGVMLVCFGFSWPMSILKTWRTRRTEGKSLAFLVLIFTGYAFGLVAKIVRAAVAGTSPELVTGLYALNGVLVGVDIALYLRFRRPAQAAEAKATAPDRRD